MASHSEEQCSTHLRALFDRFSRHELTINPPKYELGKLSVVFLGHTVSSSDIALLPRKVNAIRDYQEPHSCQQLRQLVGPVIFCQRNIANCAEMTADL